MAEQINIYQRIHAVVCRIPAGKVCTYGGVARLAGGCTALMVGYAMAGLPRGTSVPWQRVINAQGKISPHGYGYGSLQQRILLEEEGVLFDERGVIDMDRFGWP